MSINTFDLQGQANPRGFAWLTRFIRRGTLTIRLPSGKPLTLRGGAPGPDATLTLNRWRAVSRLLRRGALGFAEGFIAGDWHSDALPTLLQLLGENLDTLQHFANGIPFAQRRDRENHVSNRNNESGSRRNIACHYDLGNDFFGHWLDETMTYSAGIFRHADENLAAAQRRKNERLCEITAVQPGHRVLEIGCGWGGLLEMLGGRGIDALGISLSVEQVAYANTRLGGLPSARAVFKDYRHLDRRYDRIYSVEMFEAVGEEYWDVYAAKLAASLTCDGVAALQIITIDEVAAAGYRRRPDFIQQYVFPGGMLPTRSQVRSLFSRHGLSVTDEYRFGVDYADTIAIWRERFEAAWQEICPLGFDDHFRRQWLYYLAYCEAGFRSGRTDVIQIRLER
jgi:cyclopropane-fatty-acyl-phospholipid synthase